MRAFCTICQRFPSSRARGVPSRVRLAEIKRKDFFHREQFDQDVLRSLHWLNRPNSQESIQAGLQGRQWQRQPAEIEQVLPTPLVLRSREHRRVHGQHCMQDPSQRLEVDARARSRHDGTWPPRAFDTATARGRVHETERIADTLGYVEIRQD